jgi:hypothetical protein
VKKYLLIGGAIVVVVIVYLIYTRPWYSHEDYDAQTPRIPFNWPADAPDGGKGGKRPPPIVLIPVDKIETFVTTNIARTDVREKVKAVGITEVGRSANAAGKLAIVLDNIAIPIMYGRTYKGIISLNLRCTPPEPCKTRVLAPSQVGWSNAKTEEFKSKIRTFLQTQFRPAITDDDHIFQIDWVATDTNESFTTIVITSKDGRPLFEPMLWFSTAEKKCAEMQPPTGAQETAIDWSGYAKNAFGIELISWKGHATYRYKDGKLLTPDICPDRACLKFTHDPFWEVDNDATFVKTRPFANVQPEESLLTYQIIWSVALPKIDYDKFKLDLPPPAGNAIAGSFAYRGDGTWNKNN